MTCTLGQIAEYIHDISQELEVQARNAGFDTTAYLLRMVAEDMAETIDAEDVARSCDTAAN